MVEVPYEILSAERLSKMLTERDRLKALNAELVEALEGLTTRLSHPLPSEHPPSLFKARAVLAKVRKEG